MKAATFFAVGLVATGAAAAFQDARTGLGAHHHAIAAGAEAQRQFDQGLTLVYGFNHRAALRAFRRAAELDPAAAMPLWGIALALGPHINNPDVDPDDERVASETILRAKALAASGGRRSERDYIEALSARYSAARGADLRQLDRAYADAMARLAERYPDDLDAQTLYAESLMDLRPWALWSSDGTPSDVTPRVVAVLESVLARDPDHPGANHYYIHAVEASPHPEKALAAARRLETLVPDAGHLVHMPAHIYMRTGDFDAAARSNAQAAAIDERYMQQAGTRTGLYPLMYYNHNVHFESAAEAMAGRYADARRAADKLAANVSPYVADMPMLEPYMLQSIVVLVRFNKWDEVRRTAAPPPAQRITTAMWRYARALACAGRQDLQGARQERSAFLAVTGTISKDASYGINNAAEVLEVARLIIDARLRAIERDPAAAIPLWEAAVQAQDRLRYDEPPAWYYPVRESLGAALLRAGHADQAEQIFRRDLELSPGNGRSLFGLWRSLDAQGRADAAADAKREFERAWKSADVQLDIETF